MWKHHLLDLPSVSCKGCTELDGGEEGEGVVALHTLACGDVQDNVPAGRDELDRVHAHCNP